MSRGKRRKRMEEGGERKERSKVKEERAWKGVRDKRKRRKEDGGKE